jgi:tetratricopeptide (TPR) repeat protein
MPRFDESCRLAAVTVLAVVMASSHGLSAQTPAPVPDPAQPSAQPATQPPAAQPATQVPDASTAPATTPPASTPVVTTVIPVIPPTPEELGDSLSGHQRYQAAIAAYTKITNPSAAVWNKLGIAYQMMFNLKDASRCYSASLKLEPRNATVLNNMATVYDSMKQFGTAERYYRKALKIEPRSALIHRNLGSNLLSQHKYKKGWASYQAALAIDPQIFQSRSGASVQNPASTQERGAMHYYMAKGCVSAGNHECAIQNLRLAINEGYISPKKVTTDSSFASLYELPAFQQMIAAQGTPQ